MLAVNNLAGIFRKNGAGEGEELRIAQIFIAALARIWLARKNLRHEEGGNLLFSLTYVHTGCAKRGGGEEEDQGEVFGGHNLKSIFIFGAARGCA